MSEYYSNTANMMLPSVKSPLTQVRRSQNNQTVISRNIESLQNRSHKQPERVQRSIIAYRPSTLANQDFRPRGKPGKIE